MFPTDNCYLVPASPELREKFLRTRERLLAGDRSTEEATIDVLDLRTFNLISNRRRHIHTTTGKIASVDGTRRALVLLVDFSDNRASKTQQHYKDMLFSQGTYPTGSLKDFYWEVSHHKLTVDGDVSGQQGVTNGWYRAPKPYSYYTNNNFGTGSYPQNSQKLVEDLVDLADPFVNFADYDNDGDGVVDALFIVHAGAGAEVTGNHNHIWSHKWEITPKTVDGVRVQAYSIEPEDGKVGVFCHELGHVFGLPDLYDTDYSSSGTGGWDLMAGGSWNNGGQTPAHPTAYCKVKLGWVNPVIICNRQEKVTIKPYATNDGQIYKIPIAEPNGKEYFLLSNRHKVGFDKYLPGEGLIIEHVDENKTANTNESHYLVDIEQCDGRQDLNKGANRGDANDPFPCGANHSFTVSTTPNSKAYNGSDSGIMITDIQSQGQDITVDIKSQVPQTPKIPLVR
ncbi:M6 family metalloprotease domain-containing protein [Aetokthonos hydrillicola Thurmond2011]|uniref:M6 family metalloprotease domain-containing protein n=1 Tax=Aetokthonos hydrillicola Thurmond2011 TaxID=2712845 RepID=A0AAP5MB88_9CYAN|nr:M6 family metalloprotease domain-containing protein [Aetokthonos hydrillicola]MBO3460415.1 M6 family metalloprotease domain-containing protein [Aetokthonos hydrillicola CCALA 1050]MBW4588509.1 M6 family metalloprotease domain-containing protein [Aetokthonos hydrillicola CCALA 1050]MDR9896838.1 M6 family metalloprotease domain-containing protein [Aetokthonos hydrillicola Thurmond2011]